MGQPSEQTELDEALGRWPDGGPRVFEIHPSHGHGTSGQGDRRIDHLHAVHAVRSMSTMTQGEGCQPTIKLSMDSARLEGPKRLRFRNRESHLWRLLKE